MEKKPCLVTSITDSVAKNGKPYLKVNVKLEDKSSTVLFVWKDIDSFKNITASNKVLEINSDWDSQYPEVSSFIISDTPSDVFMDFIMTDGEALSTFKVMKGLATKNETTVLKDIIEKIFSNDTIRERFLYFPAAKGYHHNYKYGLLLHTFQLMEFARSILNNPYFSESVDADLVLTGCLLHDIGKVYEYTFDGFESIENDEAMYTSSHLSSGAEMVAVALNTLQMEGKTYSENEIRLIEGLKHIIRSHHLLTDWNAVCKPASLEAYLVFLADYYSAAFDKFNNAIPVEGTNMKKSGMREVFVDFKEN